MKHSNPSLAILSQLLDIREPVSFKEFVTSPEFCNCDELYPFWLNQDIPTSISELILDGSLASGKTSLSSYYLLYRIYILFSQGSPQKQLHMSSTSDIYCFYFSVSMTQAKRNGFRQIRNIVESCKWFQLHAPIDPNNHSQIYFPAQKFTICYASSEGHQIGLNVWGSILDESNFRNGVGTGLQSQYAEVAHLYQQILDRQASRYARPDGSINALSILISSASYQSSFTEKRKQSVKDNIHTKIITAVAYKVKPWEFSKEMFKVFIGAGSVDPVIVESDEEAQVLLKRANILGTGEESNFIVEVPINLKPLFQANISLAIQNHCGIPTNLSSSFMTNLRYYYDSLEPNLPHVFSSEVLEASTGDDHQLIEDFIPSNLEFSQRPHCIHMDASIQHDTAAVCCYRYDGLNEKGLPQHTRVFSLQIKPPAFPNSTSLSKLRQLIIDLAKYINLVAFSTDQFQSAQIRQEVQELLGIPDVRFSIDSSDVPHLLWQQCLVEGRIKQHPDEALEKEIREAVHDWKKRRVLKPEGTTDDVLQANVGALYLSESVGKNSVTSADNLYSKLNLVNTNQIRNFLRKQGAILS